MRKSIWPYEPSVRLAMVQAMGRGVLVYALCANWVRNHNK